ncbi:hydroxypyruvate reductase [Geotalea uraniireducens]|uniref:Hydroxypyruvate reductase n=1 Tax=Geotalea uraniireducens TaxID=351604 RepID=A0ABM8ENC4_9BACT|nr:glycerate kinase [Geotalea uraniireducens]BDV43913.1 hydroxypyruvate reductase [Geotalea uraniireducens]
MIDETAGGEGVAGAPALREIFAAALAAVDPAVAVGREAAVVRERYRSGGFTRLVVVGFGKAAPAMGRAIEEQLGELVSDGLLITRYGHGGRPLSRLACAEAGHPLPDAAGVAATRRLQALVAGAAAGTLLVTLISGGGSALLVAPAAGLSLADKLQTTALLLRAGAAIDELNAVRKHLSLVKGGRLAALARPAALSALILSDVIGDRLDVIASGPTAPDPTTYHDALAVLDRYRLTGQVPVAVSAHLSAGAAGRLSETPKPGEPLFAAVSNRIIGSNRLALAAARRRAEQLGYRPVIVSDALAGEAVTAGRWLAEQARSFRLGSPGTKLCLLAGGETTVTVTGAGRGGRNMELALAFAREIAGRSGISLLSAGTDGSDGPTDAAGAMADGSTVSRAKALGLDPVACLADNDSYGFFARTGGLFITGPTGTNVMDLQIVLLD